MTDGQERFELSNENLYRALLKSVKRNLKGFSKLFKTTITEEDAKALTSIYIEDIEIENLDFLKYFRNVKELSLSNCGKIRNAQGLGYLNLLENLYLYDTYIEDFSSLSACRNLEMFEYRIKNKPQYKRTDFEFLQEFDGLWEVDLTNNNVKDMNFLAYNKNLKELVLSENPITHLETLAGFNKLSWLEIENCKLKSLEDLPALPALESLYANDNLFREEQIANYKVQFAHLKTAEF